MTPGPEYAGQRIDVVVSQLLKRSRTASGDLIRDGHVRIDGHAVKPSHIVGPDVHIIVEMPAARDPAAQAQDLPLHIVYDEADFCVVDKPAGMATHPARGNQQGTLLNALLARFPSLPAINGVRRPGIVHRLDKDTSGLLVVAKSEPAMVALTRAMSERRIKRTYDAVVWGIPPNPRGVVEAPIGRDQHDRTKFTVRDDGRRAVTHYQVVERFEGIPPVAPGAPTSAALLRLELETGRTHQIRVHMAAIGYPIVGDATYGPNFPGLHMQRQALHAIELSFDDPTSGKPVRFFAPWPRDFEELVARLRAGDAA